MAESCPRGDVSASVHRSGSTGQSRRLSLLLALVLVTAGCSTGPLGTPTDGAGTPTATATPSLDEVDLPPGVRENRTVPEPLVAAHAAALRNTSHTVVRETTQREGNRTLTGRVVGRFGAGDRFLVRSRDRVAGTNFTVVTYAGAERVYRKLARNGSPRYTVGPRHGEVEVTERRRGSSVEVLRSLLELASFAPVGVRVRNGTTLVVLRATEDDLREGYRGGNVSSFETTILVTERGVVRRATVTLEGRGEGGRLSSSAVLRVTAIGETTVAEPDWLDDALAMENESA